MSVVGFVGLSPGKFGHCQTLRTIVLGTEGSYSFQSLEHHPLWWFLIYNNLKWKKGRGGEKNVLFNKNIIDWKRKT